MKQLQCLKNETMLSIVEQYLKYNFILSNIIVLNSNICEKQFIRHLIYSNFLEQMEQNYKYYSVLVIIFT